MRFNIKPKILSTAMLAAVTVPALIAAAADTVAVSSVVADGASDVSPATSPYPEVIHNEIADSVTFLVNASILTSQSRQKLDRLAVAIDSLCRLDTLTAIRIKGYSSPEGL